MVAGRRIRAAAPDDAGEIAAIYNHYIKHTVITFDIKGTVYLSPSGLPRQRTQKAPGNK